MKLKNQLKYEHCFMIMDTSLQSAKEHICRELNLAPERTSIWYNTGTDKHFYSGLTMLPDCAAWTEVESKRVLSCTYNGLECEVRVLGRKITAQKEKQKMKPVTKVILASLLYLLFAGFYGYYIFFVLDKEEVPARVNIYQKVIRENEAYLSQLRKYSAYEIIADTTATKLRQLGFINAKNVALQTSAENDKKRALEILKNVEYYASKYPQYTFISTEQFSSIGFDHGSVLSKFDDMNVFDAADFSGSIPDSVVACIEAFNKGEIDKQDLQELAEDYAGDGLSWVGNLSSSEEELKTDTSFKVFAPHYMDTNNRDPLILFPVKHGYLIIAHWEYVNE